MEQQKKLLGEEVEFEIARIQAEYAKQRSLLAIEKERMQEEIKLKEIEKTKQEIERQVTQKKATDEQAEADRKLALKRAEREEKEALSRFHRDRALGWLKTASLLLLFICLIIFLALALYRSFRWATEEPIVREVEKVVEVEKEVERIVEVEKEVTVTEIPEECTQIRRNGEIYVSCDGVTVSGSPTIGDSGLKEIPDLVTE